jgi:ketosteroid isomerase-like protein
MNAARAAAERYIEAVNARDADALSRLFAEDATLLHMVGVFEGRDAIRKFFAEVVIPTGPSAKIVTTVEEGERACAIEIEALTEAWPDQTQYVSDFFETDENGLILRLAVYRR